MGGGDSGRREVGRYFDLIMVAVSNTGLGGGGSCSKDCRVTPLKKVASHIYLYVQILYIYIHIYICTYIYIYIYIYVTHTHTHTFQDCSVARASIGIQ